MIIFKQNEDLIVKLQSIKNDGGTIGFVPTMGALHNGHVALIKQSLAANDITVVSIFVNPTQFNDKKDFEKYPVTIEKDIELLAKADNNILFMPSVEEMYPEGLEPAPAYDLGFLESILEGLYRPGHFQGVCRIVHKLLDTIQPNNLYMGQKDYQQCMVIQKLITGFNLATHLNIVPTQREKSGLAMSSRNMRLSAVAKENAAAIYKAHLYIKNNLLKLPLEQLREEAARLIIEAGFEKIDYTVVCDAFSLAPVSSYNAGQKLVVLTAAFIEGVRLIDNLPLN
ncbi:pantoate--beta-alanine ligase [Panacibacter ginsenosidivorans]|uniref:Pantothenate synthetase n=1 Tax=Panacibacter ginsenosidivorans TaxID=1813871 RepID=A0A5B8V787_9BACT|nr:pantoate--beta-alanine ligase [Panacibacter ginsenosidivorans]QEC66546.1 pantoate--beta-alanine ligase [Panacibacter ginsenosidivorans]